MSTKAVATIAAATALPMAVSARGDPHPHPSATISPTITQTLYRYSAGGEACTTLLPVHEGTNPTTYPADGSCVDTTYLGLPSSHKFTCDGTSVTVTTFPGLVNDCSGAGDEVTFSIGDCVQHGYSSDKKMTNCTAGVPTALPISDGNDHDGGDDGNDQGGNPSTSTSSSSTSTSTTGSTGSDSSSPPLTWLIAAASVAAVCVL